MTFVQQLPGYGPPTPVPVFQWESEFNTVLDLYRRLEPEKVLEVGTYHGGTLYHWMNAAAVECQVVTLDSYAVGVDNRHLYRDWCPPHVDLVVLQGDSRDPSTVGEVEAYGPYDWAFIDAGHYYGEVKADWENYGPMVKSPGVVVFHDILPPTRAHPEIEVARLWEEIKRDHLTLEIVESRAAEWGGLGVVLL